MTRKWVFALLGVTASVYAADESSTVRGYLALCEKKDWQCESVVLVRDLVMTPAQCGPEDSTQQTKEVVQWLKAHPELSDKPRADGVDAALGALYGCKHK